MNAPKALLLVKQPLAVDRPVMVLFDGTPLAEQALKAATRFARAFQALLTIFLVTESSESARTLMRQVTDLVKSDEVEARYRPVFAADALQLANAIESEAGGLLVLCRQYRRVPEDEIQNVVRLVSNPILLVR